MPAEKKVIVLILSYNGKALLDDSVSSYLGNDYPNFEIVVIDNGSTDGTREYVQERWPGVFVLRTEKNLGYSGGFNFGLDYAFNQQQAGYVLITNNDVKADPQVITELVKVAEQDPMIGFVTGKVYYYDRPGILQTVGKEYSGLVWNGRHIGGREADNGQYDSLEERYFVDDIFTLVSSSVYHDVGGYDTQFFLQCEEWDWQARAKAKGYRIYYTPTAKIWHKESMTIGKWSPEKAYYDGRNPGIVILKHQTPEFFKRYLRHHTLYFLIRETAKSLAKGRIKISLAIVRGYCSMIMWGIREGRFSYKHFF